MKILLTYISGEPDRSDPYINLLPSGLCYLHAVLREAGHDSLLANFSGWSPQAIRKQLASFKPDIIGISQWTHNRHASLETARLARRSNPASIIIMGGGHATFRYHEMLADGSPVDIVVLGEGEETLRELTDRLAQGVSWRDVAGIAFRDSGRVVVTEQRVARSALDTLPFPARYLEHSVGVDGELQPEFVLTARGCPSACSFCSSPGFWGRRVRFRSPEDIVAEILYIRDRFGLIYFSLRDDTFTADRARAIEFCRLMIAHRVSVLWNCQSRVTALDEEVLTWMKRAGCECVQLGVESGSPRILAQLDKSIHPWQVEQTAALVRKVGINLSVYLISDVPGEDEDDIRMTIELVRRIKPDDGYVSPLAYYPGTRLFDQAVADGLVRPGIFEEASDAALYAVGSSGRTSHRILRALAAGTAKGAEQRFRHQKALLGYCATTNILAGEWYRQQGDTDMAEREFREITEQEPYHPWGWLLLGELHAERGEEQRAGECYRRVLALVPNHKAARAALETKKTGP
ncbi:B12-binding domain-containing radical SAM protein [Geobacter sp. AOG2]|uniref:B12-binding domain-containing radical SAM protein n=1 Tax=Geobacter sp. AOG2 TaxID=1566347 RepID=UPI001CC7E6FB|nr:cobalamin-dependent protein [Geobacter sp. AOG2]GFE60250.1 B12-binding domain-containing radical SAM protein [Geobacter sp. AOG2]